MKFIDNKKTSFTGEEAANLILGPLESAQQLRDFVQLLNELAKSYQRALDYYKSTWDDCVGDLGLPERSSYLGRRDLDSVTGSPAPAENTELVKERWAKRKPLDSHALRCALMQQYEPWSTTGLTGEELEWWLTDGKTNFELQTFESTELQRWIGEMDIESEYTFSEEKVQGQSTSANVLPSGALSLTTAEVASCFAGLRWTESEWKKPLGDKPKWLAKCIDVPGERGMRQTRWHPVHIGAALVTRGYAKPRSVRGRFQTKPELQPWLDAWDTYAAENSITE